MKKLWKKFEKVSCKCFEDMFPPNAAMDNWDEGFSILLEIIAEGRQQDSSFAQELYQLDESTEYQYDVSGWFEEYIDQLNMRERYDRLQYVCEKALKLFQWKEEDPSDMKFYIAYSMGGQGKNKENVAFCEKWYAAEPDNVVAATSLIYARIAEKDLKGAEEIVRRFITKDTACSEENEIIFSAASLLYKINGNKKEEKRMNQALKAYEEEVNEYFLNMEEDDIDMDLEMDISDDELPFR